MKEIIKIVTEYLNYFDLKFLWTQLTLIARDFMKSILLKSKIGF